MRKRRSKLDDAKAKLIREEWEKNPRPNSNQLGKKYGVSVSTIEAVIKRKTWREAA